ncbi:MAG: cytochrome P450 [Verrucomicrobiota bacterium]
MHQNLATAPLPPIVRKPGHWLLGPIYHMQRDPIKWMGKWLAEYDDIFTITAPIGRATVVGRPEWARQVLADRYSRYQEKSQSYIVLRLLMGNGLVTSSGEFWRGQRKLAQPAFHRRRLDSIFGMMAELTLGCAKKFSGYAASGDAVDVAPVLSHLTLDIISRAMFSTDVDTGASDVSSHIATLNEYALRLLRQPWLFLLPRRLPTPLNHREIHAGLKLEKIVMDIISQRRRGDAEHDDLLALLLSACDEETGRGMSDEQLRDEVMTIFVAGHETTANAMCWLMHLVSQHPEIEEKLMAEIDAAWAADALSSGSIALFPYTRQVVEESLRLYPTIWSVGRRCGEADEIGGFRIPSGMNVIVPIFHFHWSERYWSEPQRFDPERFSPERRPAAEPMIYFPFGAGPRSCIGNHFAMQELVIMTAIFYRYFQFRPEPGFVVEADPLITLRPKQGVRLKMTARRPLESLG